MHDYLKATLITVGLLFIYILLSETLAYSYEAHHSSYKEKHVHAHPETTIYQKILL